MRLSRYYIDEYDTIFAEELAVANMKQNAKLSKAITDASGYTFLNML